jgi:hypothetical protein
METAHATSQVPFLIFLVTGVLTSALGLPLKRRKVKPNYLYGFRTPATLKDEALWYDVNAKAGGDLVGIGLVLCAVATVLYSTDAPTQTLTGACVTWLLAGTTLSFARGLMTIQQRKRLARKNNEV